MGEVVYLADKLIPHWEAALASAEIAREVAIQNLARLAVQASGQLEFNYNTLQEDPRSIAREGEW